MRRQLGTRTAAAASGDGCSGDGGDDRVGEGDDAAKGSSAREGAKRGLRLCADRIR